MIAPALFARIRADLDRWETPILWMYLDSEGLVTVGCGAMLPNAASASVIAFYNNKTRHSATPAEIIAAWTLLHTGASTQKAAAGHGKFSYKHYEKLTDIRITLDTSNQLRDAHISADYAQLQTIYYPGFDSFPDDVKLALFDMIYNLGAGRSKSRHHRANGLRGYMQMNAAISRGDWATASKTCLRHGIPMARNQMTAALFANCAKPATAAPQVALPLP
jgi:hypothetical protein